MIMRIAVFWHMMLCSFLDTYEHYGRTCISYIVGRRVNRRANSSTLKMKDAGGMFLKTLVLMYRTTGRHNPEDNNLCA